MTRLILVAALLWMTACSRSGGESDRLEVTPERIPVRLRGVTRVERPATIQASGSVEALDQVDLAFQVAGRVARVGPQEGAFINRGALLAQLDPADYRFGAQAAAAQTAQARAGLEKAQAGARPQELEQARIQFARAEDEYRRMRVLYERKSIAPNDFRKIEAAYQAAREQLALLESGARREDVAAAQAAVQQAEAAQNVAEKRVADATLRAPISGQVARRAVDPGEMAGAGVPVFTIVNIDTVRVRVGVPESDISLLRVGQAASVTAPALGDRAFNGTVETIGAVAESTSRTYPVRILVKNPQRLLRAGMIAEARVRTNSVVKAVTIPGEAVVRDAQGATLVYVYFPQQGRVFARRVQVGSVYEREVEVTSGLSGGEQIVVGGQQNLREGVLVEPMG